MSEVDERVPCSVCGKSFMQFEKSASPLLCSSCFIKTPNTVNGVNRDTVHVSFDNGVCVIMNRNPIGPDTGLSRFRPSRVPDTCIECGSVNMQREGRCMSCRECGWSKCGVVNK